MKLWKFTWSNGGALGLCVVRAESQAKALELALAFAKKEDLSYGWLVHADVAECAEGEGVLAWGEA